MTLLVGQQEGYLAHKKYGGDGGGGHWLDRMEWRPAGWSVCLPLLIFPCTIESRSSLLAPAQLGGPGKRAVKRFWCGVVYTFSFCLTDLLFWNHPKTELLWITGAVFIISWMPFLSPNQRRQITKENIQKLTSKTRLIAI